MRKTDFEIKITSKNVEKVFKIIKEYISPQEIMKFSYCYYLYMMYKKWDLKKFRKFTTLHNQYLRYSEKTKTWDWYYSPPSRVTKRKLITLNKLKQILNNQIK